MSRRMNGYNGDKQVAESALGMDTWMASTPAITPGLMPVVDASVTQAWPELVSKSDATERTECGFDGCTTNWMRLWKRRDRPVFEGSWGCGRGCIRGLVERSVRREMEGAGGAELAVEHAHRMPLGLVLLSQGLVTQAQLRQALAAQRAAGRGRIGEWLVESCGVDERNVMRGLGMQWQCPVLSLSGFDAVKMALAMPAVLRELCGVVPLRVAGGRILYAGFEESVDAAAAFALERMCGLRVESGLLSITEFKRAMGLLVEPATVKCLEDTVADGNELMDRAVGALLTLQPVASKMVRLRDRYWMRLWLERGAISNNGMLPATGEDVVDLLFRVRRDSVGIV